MGARGAAVVCTVLLLSVVFAAPAPVRVTRGLLSLWDLTEGAGGVLADSGPGAALNLSFTAGAGVQWNTATHGLAVDLRSGTSAGPIGSGAGVNKIYASTTSATGGYNMTVESWVLPASFPNNPNRYSIFQLCDSDMSASSTTVPCLSMQLGNHTSLDAKLSTVMGSQWDPSTGFRRTAGGWSDTLQQPVGQLLHLVTRYTTSEVSACFGPSPCVPSGASVFDHFVNGELSLSAGSPGWPLNRYGGASEAHCWNNVPAAGQRATLGFTYDSTHTAQQGGFHGQIFLVSVYSSTLSDDEIAQNFAAGPPSIQPVATGGTARTEQEVPVTIVLPATDGDQTLGWDMALEARVVSVSAGYFNNSNGSPLALGVTSSSGTAMGANLTYTPPPGFFGTVNVTYRAVDARGKVSAATARLVITVAPRNAPVAKNFTAAVYVGLAGTVSMLATTTDAVEPVDAMLLTPLPAMYGALSLANGSAVSTGVWYSPPAFSQFAQFVYTGPANVSFLDGLAYVPVTLTFTVRSYRGTSPSMATLTLQISNSVQALPVDAATTVSTAVAIALAGEEVVGGNFTMYVTSLPASGAVYQVGSNVPLQAGEPVLDPTGRVLYRPNDNFVGDDAFQYRARSLRTGMLGGVGVVTVHVLLSAVPPVPVAQTVVLYMDTPYAVFALDAVTPNPIDTLTFTVLNTPVPANLLQVDAAGNLTATPVMAGDTVANKEGMLAYTSFTVTHGTPLVAVPINFTATDAFGATGNPATVTVEVRNTVFIGPQTVAVRENAEATITLEALTRDGSSFVVSIVSLPAHGSLLSAADRSGLGVGSVLGAPYMLVYVPEAHYRGPDAFSVQNAAPADTVVAQITLDVTRFNVPPSFTVPTSPLTVVNDDVLTVTGVALADPDSSILSVTITPSFGVVSLSEADGYTTQLVLGNWTLDRLQAAVSKFYFRSTNDSSVVANIPVTLALTATDETNTTSASVPISVVFNITLDTSLIIAFAVAGLGALFIGAGLAFWLAWRRRDQPTVLPPPPDFNKILFGGKVTTKVPDANTPTGRAVDSYEQLLLAKDLTLCLAMGQVAMPDEMDTVARNLVLTFEAKKETMRLLRGLIVREVQNANSVTELFRVSSVASRAIKQYTKMIGLNYLYYTLGPQLLSLQMEAEATGAVGGKAADFETEEADVHVNKWSLLVITQRFYLAITESVKDIPKEILDLSRFLGAEVAKKYPEAVHPAVGGMFILRFVCHGITDPVALGLLQHDPPKDLQRMLVLVAKTLQHLVNATEFREPHMDNMNVFVRINSDGMARFFDALIKPGPDAAPSAVPVPATHSRAALVELYNLAVRSQTSLDNVLAQNKGADAKTIREKVASILTLDDKAFARPVIPAPDAVSTPRPIEAPATT